MELCGGELRTQVYRDSTWFDPNAVQLATALQEYNDTLAQFLDAAGQYQSAIEQWQSETKTSITKRFSAWLQPRQEEGLPLTPQQTIILNNMRTRNGDLGIFRNQLSM